jgi:hypothetical protein
MHRKSLLLTGSEHRERVNEELPPPKSHEVLILTTAGAISIGAIQYN